MLRSQLLGLILAAALCSPCLAQTDSSSSLSPAQTNSDLSSLEKRLFDEIDSSETVEQRLDRLERFVFGSVRTGSPADRLNRLMMDMPNTSTATDAESNSGTQPTANTAPGAQSNAPQNAQTNESTSQTTPAMSAPAPQQGGGGNGDYPTVTALEKAILGHPEENLPLPTRLSKLEQKAFGKATNSNDLAARVDRLKNYEREHNLDGEQYLSRSAPVFASRQPTQTLSITAQLDQIEKVVFAKTYPSDGIVSRLDRLEKTVFPEKPVETFASVPSRVSRLIRVLGIGDSNDANRLAARNNSYSQSQNYSYSPPAFSDQNQTTAMQQKSKSRHPFLHKLGHVLGQIGEEGLMSMGGGMMGGGMMGPAPGYSPYGSPGGFGSPYGSQAGMMY